MINILLGFIIFAMIVLIVIVASLCMIADRSDRRLGYKRDP